MELEAGSPPRPQAPRRGQKAAPRVPYRTFTSQSGARILVGRSARDNDELLRAARGNDLWLHVRAVQGSHVIVPDPGEAPDPRTLRDAALLAAHFSSARGVAGAEVAWTRRKYVKKPKGAAPQAYSPSLVTGVGGITPFDSCHCDSRTTKSRSPPKSLAKRSER